MATSVLPCVLLVVAVLFTLHPTPAIAQDCNAADEIVAAGETRLIHHTRDIEYIARDPMTSLQLTVKAEPGFAGLHINVAGSNTLEVAWFPADSECIPRNDQWYVIKVWVRVFRAIGDLTLWLYTGTCVRVCVIDTTIQDIWAVSVVAHGSSKWLVGPPHISCDFVDYQDFGTSTSSFPICSKPPVPASTTSQQPPTSTRTLTTTTAQPPTTITTTKTATSPQPPSTTTRTFASTTTQPPTTITTTKTTSPQPPTTTTMTLTTTTTQPPTATTTTKPFTTTTPALAQDCNTADKIVAAGETQLLDHTQDIKYSYIGDPNSRLDLTVKTKPGFAGLHINVAGNNTHELAWFPADSACIPRHDHCKPPAPASTTSQQPPATTTKTLTTTTAQPPTATTTTKALTAVEDPESAVSPRLCVGPVSVVMAVVVAALAAT